MSRKEAVLVNICALFLCSILMSCSNDNSTDNDNNPPAIQSLTATPNSIYCEGIITLYCDAVDIDQDLLTYHWSSNVGLFTNGNEDSTVQWQAPSQSAYCTIQISVSDGIDSDMAEITIPVDKPPLTPAPGEQWTAYIGASRVPVGLVFVQGGTFWMGAQDGEEGDGTSEDEYPRHRVTISEGFWIGKYEITQLQWEEIAGYQNSPKAGNSNYPQDYVGYDEIIDNFLNPLGDNWRLPTEAEWEYACRAGADTSWFWWGNNYEYLSECAWCRANSDYSIHAVGTKNPNPWGIYDMHGNVWEWCNDWYSSNYYEQSPEIDPFGPSAGVSRVIRGGDYWTENGCRSAGRFYSMPEDGQGNGCPGFRVVYQNN